MNREGEEIPPLFLFIESPQNVRLGRNFYYITASAFCQEKSCTKIKKIFFPKLCTLTKRNFQNPIDRCACLCYNSIVVKGRWKHKAVNATAPCQQVRKKFLRNFKKPLDKSPMMCYNIDVLKGQKERLKAKSE